MTDNSPTAKRARADALHDEVRTLLRTSVQDGTHDSSVQARVLALQAEAYGLRQSARAAEHAVRMQALRRQRTWWRR